MLTLATETEKGKKAMMKIPKRHWCNRAAGSRRSRQKTAKILHRLLTVEMYLDPQTMHLQPAQETEAGKEMRKVLQVLKKNSSICRN